MFRNRKIRILVLLLTIVVLLLSLVEVSGLLKSKEKSAKPKVTTERVEPYTLYTNRTKLQEELLPQLKDAIETKKGKLIVTEASKYFISDYFTLRNKKSANTVGGLGFVFKPVKASFKTNAQDSYYNDISGYKERYGQDNLPLVKSVNVEKISRAKVDKSTLKETQNQKIERVYDVKVSWTYEENETLDASNIVNSIIIRYVRDNNKDWYVYELIGVDTNEGY